jgi:hypothetical protein
LGDTLVRDPLEHHPHDPCLVRLDLVTALETSGPVFLDVSISVRRRIAYDQFTHLHLEALAAAASILDHDALELAERTEDVDDKISDGTTVRRQVPEDELDAVLFEVTLNDRKIGNVSAKPIDVVYENPREELTRSIIA